MVLTKGCCPGPLREYSLITIYAVWCLCNICNKIWILKLIWPQGFWFEVRGDTGDSEAQRPTWRWTLHAWAWGLECRLPCSWVQVGGRYTLWISGPCHTHLCDGTWREASSVTLSLSFLPFLPLSLSCLPTVGTDYWPKYINKRHPDYVITGFSVLW